MDIEEYSKLALRTTNGDLSYEDCISNACMGIAGEAGELVDVFKKFLFHDKPVDVNHVVKELGDLLFYMNWLSTKLDIPWDVIMTVNIAKLSARYPNGFSAHDSNNRDLYKEEEAIIRAL